MSRAPFPRSAAQMNFLAARNSVSAVAPEPSSSLTISPAVRGGRAVVSSTSLHATDRPTWAASTPRSASDERLQRLLLRRHDPLERRVAGLAGLVGHRQHQRQRRADHLGRGVAVALDPDLVALGLDDRRQRHLRPAQPLGEHRRDDAHRAVGRGHAAHHQVDLRVARRASRPPWPAPARSRSRRSRRSRRRRRARPGRTPICSALRTASRAFSGPTVSAVTVCSSSSRFSVICRACSTAYSSSSDSRPSTPTRSTVPSDSKCRSAVASGTCFTQTTMFMNCPSWGAGTAPSCALG